MRSEVSVFCLFGKKKKKLGPSIRKVLSGLFLLVVVPGLFCVIVFCAVVAQIKFVIITVLSLWILDDYTIY